MEDDQVQSSQMGINDEVKKTSSLLKNPLILGVSFFVLLAILVFFVFLLLNKNSKTSTIYLPNQEKKTDTSKVIVSDGGSTDTVVSIAKYLESQKNNNGSYMYQSHPEVTCPKKDGKQDCYFYKDNNVIPVTVWTAFGYFSAYKTTNDYSYLQKTDTDLKTLVSWCDRPDSNCNYLLAQPIIMASDVKNLNISSFIKKQSAILASSKPSTDLMLVSIESRELALASKYLNDKALLTEANKRLDLANKEIQKQIDNPFVKGVKLPIASCWATLAGVEIGISENSKETVRNAVEYLGIDNRDQAIADFPNPVNIHPCIETYLLAGKYLNDTGYKDKGRKLLQSFLSNFYDSPTNKILFGESGTTYYSGKKSTSTDTNMVLISDSSYTNYLIYLNSTL